MALSHRAPLAQLFLRGLIYSKDGNHDIVGSQKDTIISKIRFNHEIAFITCSVKTPRHVPQKSTFHTNIYYTAKAMYTMVYINKCSGV